MHVYAEVIAGLAALRGSPDALGRVFGAESHGFRTHACLTEAEVSAFEERHRIGLPADYRGFLLHVGNGGAGPMYGVFKLGRMDSGWKSKAWSENDGFVGTLANPFPHTDVWNDLSGEPEHDASRESDPAWEDDYQARLDAWEETYWRTSNVDGAIPICHSGCADRQWLIVAGPESGHIWDDGRADRSGLRPFRQGGRQRTTFMEWYRDWLAVSLKIAGAR